MLEQILHIVVSIFLCTTVFGSIFLLIKWSVEEFEEEDIISGGGPVDSKYVYGPIFWGIAGGRR